MNTFENPQDITARFLAWMQERAPDVEVHAYERRGRSDHVVLLHESYAADLLRGIPEAAVARQSIKDNPWGERPWIAWQRMEQARFGRLRLSPARVTRPGIDLLELPLPEEVENADPPTAFAGWMEHHQIVTGPHAVNHEQILYGAFLLGRALRRLRWRRKESILALDQNQSTGNRCHLILDGAKPISPFPLHILLFKTHKPPPFQVDKPSLTSQFGIRANNKDQLLIAQSPKDTIRFYLNETAAPKPLKIPDPIENYLEEHHQFKAVQTADDQLKFFHARVQSTNPPVKK
jgi:hypothetical protein